MSDPELLRNAEEALTALIPRSDILSECIPTLCRSSAQLSQSDKLMPATSHRQDCPDLAGPLDQRDLLGQRGLRDPLDHRCQPGLAVPRHQLSLRKYKRFQCTVAPCCSRHTPDSAMPEHLQRWQHSGTYPKSAGTFSSWPPTVKRPACLARASEIARSRVYLVFALIACAIGGIAASN